MPYGRDTRTFKDRFVDYDEEDKAQLKADLKEWLAIDMISLEARRKVYEAAPEELKEELNWPLAK
jgi:hypothetical protein